ncbi:MAG: Spo0B domain-containing protein [Bacillota bacterium]|nr:Spo0B domain-containing protein [Bacillota bacterium]
MKSIGCEPIVDLDDLILLLRSQKHDVLNHLQVVHGFLQLGKSEMAKDYLGQAMTKIQHHGRILKIQSPELVGVLYHYRELGERIGMDIDVQIEQEIVSLGERGKRLAKTLKQIFELIIDKYPLFEARVEMCFYTDNNKHLNCELLIYTSDFSEASEALQEVLERAEASYEVGKNTYNIMFKI